MKPMKVNVKPPDMVEKAGGAFQLKPSNRHADDLIALTKGGLKVDDLAGVVGHLMERVKMLEEGH